MADGPDTLSVISDVDNKRYKLVIKSGLRTLTVASIKKHLVNPTGVHIEDQVLRLNGEILDDRQTGDQLGLERGTILRLSVAEYGLPAPQPPPPAAPPANPVAPPAGPPYYTPSESTVPATNQISTASKESSMEPMGRPLPAPYAAVASNQNNPGLQPDMRGRERQKESELHDLQRRTEELHTDRSLMNQAGLRAQQSHQPQLQPASPLYTNPNPARIDPSLAGPSDFQAAQERRYIESQAALAQQIEMEKGRLSQMQSNATERQERHERMINGSRRERELEERIAVLEQHCERMQAANETSRSNEVVMEQNLTELERQLLHKNQEIENLRSRVAAAEAKAAAAQVPTNENVGGLELARRNLVEFGKDLGVESELDFDENLTCVVGVEQRYTVLLTYDQTTERLYMYSTLLTYLPKDLPTKMRLYELLLEGALMGREMAGGGVGLSMKNELLLMSTSVDLKHSDVYALKSVAPVFVDCLAKWRQAVKDFVSKEPSIMPPGRVSPSPQYGGSISPRAFTPVSQYPQYPPQGHPQSQPQQPQPQQPPPQLSYHSYQAHQPQGINPPNIDAHASILAQQIDEQEKQLARQQLMIERQRKLATSAH